MPYATGTTSTASGLFSAINTFLVSDCGWNLHDNVNSNDHVYYSAGSSGTENIYVRLQKELKDRKHNPAISWWQNQEYAAARYSHVNVSTAQYWNNSTHTARSEQTGELESWCWYGGSGGSGTDIAGLVYGSQHRSTNNVQTWTASLFTENTHYRSIGASPTTFHPFKAHGYNVVSRSSAGVIRRTDFVYGTGADFSTVTDWYGLTIGPANDTGEMVFYAICNQTPAVTSPWKAYKVSDGTLHANLANPPGGGSTFYNFANAVYDGNNYIYMSAAYNSTTFYRYSISANTWTTLTAMPLAGNGTGTQVPMQQFTYIPKTSPVGIANSWSYDRIYYKPAHLTSTNVYYYNVGADTWTTLTAPTNSIAAATAPYMHWPTGNYFYWCQAYTGARHRAFDLAAGSFNAADGLPETGQYGNHIIYQDSYRNQITVDSDGTTYWLFGDLDHLSVVVKWADNQYHFYYVGIIDSFYSTQKVVTTATTASGINISISVSGVFDQFQLGEDLYIYDPSTNGYAENFNFSSSGVNTITAGSLTNSYSTGSIIGVDPQPVVSLVNGFDSVFVLHGPEGTGGINTPTGLGMTPTIQRLTPAVGLGVYSASAPGFRGHYQVWPIIVGNWPDSSPYQLNKLDPIQTLDGNSSYREIRGQLINTFCIGRNTTPISEDIITVGSEQYMVFRCNNIFSESACSAAIVVGPMS